MLTRAHAQSYEREAHLIGLVFVQSLRDFLADHGPAWAASVAYFGLLSAFPLLLAFLALASFLVDPAWAVERAHALFGAYLPAGSDLVQQTIQAAIASRVNVGALAVLLLLGTGTQVFGILDLALNVAEAEPPRTSLAQRLAIQVLLTATVGLLVAIALGASVLLDVLQNRPNLLPIGRDVLLGGVTDVLPLALLLFALFLIYRLVPRGRPDGRAALFGAASATALFTLARPLFVAYVRLVGNFNLVYGGLGIAVLLVLWAWVVGLILLLGGELAAHAQAMLLDGRSAADVGRQHARRNPGR